MTNENLLTYRQISEILGVSISKLKTIVNNHRLPIEIRMKKTRKYVFLTFETMIVIKKLINEDKIIYKKAKNNLEKEPKQKPIAMPLANGYQIFYKGDLKGFVLSNQLEVFRDKIEVCGG